MDQRNPREEPPRLTEEPRSGPKSDRPVLPDSEDRLKTGDLYLRVGDHAQALESFLSLLSSARGTDLFALGRRIAYCQDRLGRHREAIALMEPLVGNAPDLDLLLEPDRIELGRCYLELGNAYFRAGRLEDAQRAGLSAIESLGDAGGVHLGLSQNLLGAVALRSGDIELARTHFRRALDRFRSLGDVSNLAFAYNNLGAVYKEACEWDRALEHYHAAFYLQATEGEYQDQGAVHQNLGIVMMKVGRYDEARDHLHASLKRAIELGDGDRALRARISMLRLSRESLDFSGARKILEECRRFAPDPIPEREACLLDLEETQLDLSEGNRADASARLTPLEERVSRMASRGDLMIETHRLAGRLAAENGEWQVADERLQSATALAREDRDQYQEQHSLLEQMRLAGMTGRLAEADKHFQHLRSRFEQGGERPSLARLYEWKGDQETENRLDPDEAIDWYERSVGLWKRMGRDRLVAAIEIKIAGSLLTSGRRDDAAAVFESLQEKLDKWGPQRGESILLRAAGRLADRLEKESDPKSTGVPDGNQTYRRLVDILGWDAEPTEKLRASLQQISETLEADGALLCEVTESTLEVVSSISMGRLDGNRSLPRPADLVERPGVSRLKFGDEDVRSSLVVPAILQGKPHLFYFERREATRRRFVRSELNYALVLISEVSRTLPQLPVSPEPTGEAARKLEEIRHGIYVADVITQDSRMLSILSLIHKVGDTDLTVLLQGETGTGKKLLANAIHRISERRGRPIVTVDCAALPDSLLESELFGHRKGSFTGATQDRIGLLEEANGGTIFLDEIDKAGLAVQRRFLHMLDTGEIRPVGSTGYRTLDVRVVCATSCPDLRSEVEAGNFLKDLYYRLNDISIQIPALRDRPDDVPLLTKCFIDRFSTDLGRQISGVALSMKEEIRAHSWPGNVRELEKAIRRAVTLSDKGAVIGADLLPAAVLESVNGATTEGHGGIKARVESYEKKILIEVLDRLRWNKSRAADELGLSRKGLKGKIERYRLDRRGGRRT